MNQTLVLFTDVYEHYPHTGNDVVYRFITDGKDYEGMAAREFIRQYVITSLSTDKSSDSESSDDGDLCDISQYISIVISEGCDVSIDEEEFNNEYELLCAQVEWVLFVLEREEMLRYINITNENMMFVREVIA